MTTTSNSETQAHPSKIVINMGNRCDCTKSKDKTKYVYNTTLQYKYSTDEKVDIPSKTAQAAEKPSVKNAVEPTVPVAPVSEPGSEPTPTISTTESPTPPDEWVSIVKIKNKESQSQEELEEGEIVDEDEDDDGEMMMPVLRYKYSEDQWSPLNLEGKKHYDREFLLQFQNDVNAIQKPAGLPDIPDMILDKPQCVGRQFICEQQPRNKGQPDYMEFTTRYLWGVRQGGGGGSRSRGMPRQPNKEFLHMSAIGICQSDQEEISARRSSALKLLSDENMERKTKDILYDYFAGQNLEGAVVRVKELSTQQHHHFVLFAIYIVLERSGSARKQTGHLLHDLIKQSVISVGSFIEGFADVLTLAEDLETDNPKIWQFYGELMSPMIQDGTVPLNFIKLAANPLIARTKKVDVLCEITGGAIKRERNVEMDIPLGPGGGVSWFAGWGWGGIGRTTGRPSLEKENPNNTVSGFPVDGGRSEQESQPSATHPSSMEFQLLSADEMEKKTKAILDKYLAFENKNNEAVLCVQELSAQNHHQFVHYAINHVLERSSIARKLTAYVLHDLVNQKVISVDNYIKGLVQVLEFAEDLEIDIPKIWQYYGEMISPMIQDNSVPLSFLKQATQPLIANNKAGVLLAEILHDASRRKGHKNVARLWISSGMHWSDFVPEKKVEQFLRDNGLEFTKCGPTTPTTGLPLKEIETKFNELIVQNKADNLKVFDWIEGNVDEPTTKQPKFIRALMTAVSTSAIKGEKGKERLEPKEISNRNDLLQKYLDHQAETELQALYALQILITKLEHPQGILRGMFDTLYDGDIISKNAFFQWEKSEEEPEGKSSCLKQTVQLFTWLREAEDDS